MTIEIRVPTLGESITEATIGKWYKKAGDFVTIDEPIVELETDKVTLEIPAPASGFISNIIFATGVDVQVGSIIGMITKKSVKATVTDLKNERKHTSAPSSNTAVELDDILVQIHNDQTARRVTTPTKKLPHRLKTVPSSTVHLRAEKNITPLKQTLHTDLDPIPMPQVQDESYREERVPMSRLRRTIATRLQDVQQHTAMLTTFNEVDMSNIMALRSTYREAFFEKHGIKLGIMSFFVKAIIQALKEFPTLNAEIDKNDLIYKNYYHIGVAVGTDKGLVVPVLKDADQMKFDGIEKNIIDLAQKAKSGQLQIEQLQGGTFSITNGGIYGSMMSTPILNAPQSGILGMHKIQDRPIALDGQVVIRPMMYLALTYDHRIVDGKDAVSFLVRIKENLESPERLFLDL